MEPLNLELNDEKFPQWLNRIYVPIYFFE
jgi:hypothetical protein